MFSFLQGKNFLPVDLNSMNCGSYDLESTSGLIESDSNNSSAPGRVHILNKGEPAAQKRTVASWFMDQERSAHNSTRKFS